MRGLRYGFTLVEVLVVAPIVILSIGAFIALIVTLTGNSLVSRESSIIQYNIQDALDSIDKDVRISSGFLATNSIPITASNPQGYNADPDTPSTAGSTVKFSNIDLTNSGGSPKSLILQQFTYDKDPLRPRSTPSAMLYLANTPNPCSGEFKKNTPMYTNVVYFVANDSLWRRVLVPTNYTTPSSYCGATTVFQRPSCAPATTHSYCKVQDSKVLENVKADDFKFTYFPSAGSTAPNNAATNPSSSDSARELALELNGSVDVTLTSEKKVAGRDVSKSASLRSTKMNSAGTLVRPATPASVQLSVVDGSDIDVTWPSSSRAAVYDVDYSTDGGPWISSQVGGIGLSHKITTAGNGVSVAIRVVARNTSGASAYTTSTTSTPLWVPLALQGSWSDYSSAYNSAAVTKTSSGFVIVRGLVKATSAAAGSTIAQLPPSYRPTGQLMFGTLTSGDVSARVDVTSDGRIIFSDGGLVGWYSFETIRYVAAESTATRTPLVLQSGFTNNGGVYAPASYTQDSSGRVSVQGLLLNGTRTMSTPIAAIPAAQRPALYEHYPSRSGVFHHIAITNNSGLIARGDGTGAYSINTNYLPASHTDWTDIPLSSSWVTHSAIYPTAQYTKTSDGVVHLRGLVKSGVIGATSVLGTLPPGYRPANRLLDTTVSNNLRGRVDILANGNIHSQAGSNVYFSLNGISFIAEQ